MNIGQETEQIEFKKTTGELKEGVISVASMLNKHGKCTLYFGVKNDGEVIGQQIGNETLRDVSKALSEFIKPQIVPTVSLTFMDDKNVICVEAKGNDVTYSAYGKYYVRVADEDREVAPNALRDMMASKSNTIVEMESNDQVLSFNQLKMLYANAGYTLNEETYKHNLHLLTKDGKYNMMANLLSDSNAYSIKVAVFGTTDKTKLIKRNEYGFKCLLVAITQVLDYAEVLNETAVSLGGGVRKESKRFDMACFKEAWLNACLHNRWSKQTPPAVYFFSDRIEIISIGGLPSDYSEEDFFAGRSRPVNLELQQIMLQLDYIEQTGHGVPLIVSKYGRQAFDISDNFITVTIPLANPNTQSDEKSSKSSVKLSHTQTAVLELLQMDNTMSITEIMHELNLSRTAIINALNRLKSADVIRRVGTTQKGHWEIL